MSHHPEDAKAAEKYVRSLFNQTPARSFNWARIDYLAACTRLRPGIEATGMALRASDDYAVQLKEEADRANAEVVKAVARTAELEAQVRNRDELLRRARDLMEIYRSPGFDELIADIDRAGIANDSKPTES